MGRDGERWDELPKEHGAIKQQSMNRFFNTAGPCLPEKHYMLPPERRLVQVRDLIDRGAYFVIHAPRQTGKTTLIRVLSRKLTAEVKFAALTVSLESFTSPDVDKMLPRIVDKILQESQKQLPKGLEAPLRQTGPLPGVRSGDQGSRSSGAPTWYSGHRGCCSFPTESRSCESQRAGRRRR